MIRALAVWLTVGFVAPLVLVALGVEVAPRRTARSVARLPGVGGLATRECWRCGAPELRTRAEEMPTVFRSGDVTDALTICFCTTCSLEMTLDERLELLHREARKRGIEVPEVDDGK